MGRRPRRGRGASERGVHGRGDDPVADDRHARPLREAARDRDRHPAGPCWARARSPLFPAPRIKAKPVQRPRPPVHPPASTLLAQRRAARRADGLLSTVIPHPGMEFDPVAMVGGQLEQVRRLAASEGLDPAGSGAALRIDPVTESSVDAVVEVSPRTRDTTDVDAEPRPSGRSLHTAAVAPPTRTPGQGAAIVRFFERAAPLMYGPSRPARARRGPPPRRTAGWWWGCRPPGCSPSRRGRG